jgi:hypothetical protein
LFWIDRWLLGKNIAEIAPLLFAAIPKRRRQKTYCARTLLNHAWTLDIQGALTIGIIVDYIQVWDLLIDFQLQSEVEDYHIWRMATNGQYSAKSSYDSLFLGASLFKPHERIWKSWAPR